MELAERALAKRAQGEAEESIALFEKALEEELRAIEELDRNNKIIEPTYSVLHRSAGTLALDCNQIREAERIVAKALSKNPPHEIAEELRDLLEQIHFKRHLELKGVDLGEDEMQLSLSGPDVGYGFVRSNEFLNRVNDSSKLIQRIVERRNQEPFRESGRPKQAPHNFYISTPRAASFSVTLKLGRPTNQPNLPGMPRSETNEIIDEFMDLVELADNSKASEIQERIPDPAYLKNFLGLAKKMAPDGKRIRQVGFTTIRGGNERSVKITKTASEFSTSTVEDLSSGEAESVEVQGGLRYADSTKSSKETIKIIDKDGKSHTVKVPEGMMNDIVRPMWDSLIVIKGVRKGRGRGSYIELQDIAPMETD